MQQKKGDAGNIPFFFLLPYSFDRERQSNLSNHQITTNL